MKVKFLRYVLKHNIEELKATTKVSEVFKYPQHTGHCETATSSVIDLDIDEETVTKYYQNEDQMQEEHDTLDLLHSHGIGPKVLGYDFKESAWGSDLYGVVVEKVMVIDQASCPNLEVRREIKVQAEILALHVCNLLGRCWSDNSLHNLGIKDHHFILIDGGCMGRGVTDSWFDARMDQLYRNIRNRDGQFAGFEARTYVERVSQQKLVYQYYMENL